MEYLWGEATVKRRVRTKDTKLLNDEGTKVGQWETTTEVRKGTFGEHITIHPCRGGMCVLGFLANNKH
jgi:hypothetical protein